MQARNHIIRWLLVMLSWVGAVVLGTWLNLAPSLWVGLGLGSFWVLYGLFDRWLWRIPPWRWLVSVPDLNGAWEGSLISSYQEQSQINPITLHIRQRWLSLYVRLSISDAGSHSLSATYFRQPNGLHGLAYIYETEPAPNADPSVQPHRGLCLLNQTERGNLSGYYLYYYRDEARREVVQGQIVVKRLDRSQKFIKDIGVPL